MTEVERKAVNPAALSAAQRGALLWRMPAPAGKLRQPGAAAPRDARTWHSLQRLGLVVWTYNPTGGWHLTGEGRKAAEALISGSRTSSTLAPLHPDAVGFTLFRVQPNGNGRAYTSVEFTRGWSGAEHFLRQLRACGYVRNSSSAPDGWHVLDVLNAAGDIVQDYAVPPHPSRAFAYIKRKLRLAVASTDGAAVTR